MTNFKNILVTVTMVLMSITSFGQITDVTNNSTKVGELSMGGILQGTMTMYEDGTFIFSYKDYKYNHITDFKSISFKDLNEVVQFKEILDTQMTMKKKTEREIQLSDGTYIVITTNKSMGMVGLSLGIVDNGIVSLTGVNKNQMDRLFGFINNQNVVSTIN